MNSFGVSFSFLTLFSIFFSSAWLVAGMEESQARERGLSTFECFRADDGFDLELDFSNIGDLDNSILREAVLNITSGDQDATVAKYGNISDWCVDHVTHMDLIFFNEVEFNEDISNWNVSAVVSMYGMFNSAEAFNQNIAGWDVSAVTDMGSMFNFAFDFNQNIADWVVSSVTDMSFMFLGASMFNQSLCQWGQLLADVSATVNTVNMFASSSCVDQGSPIIGQDSTWCTPCVLDSNMPSTIPSAMPSARPSISARPSQSPSAIPSLSPSAKPSISASPSQPPSTSPSASPSDRPKSCNINIPILGPILCWILDLLDKIF